MGDVYNAILAFSAALTSVTGLIGMVLQTRRMSKIEREQAAEHAAHLYGEHDAIEWAHAAQHMNPGHGHEPPHHPDTGITDGGAKP